MFKKNILAKAVLGFLTTTSFLVHSQTSTHPIDNTNKFQILNTCGSEQIDSFAKENAFNCYSFQAPKDYNNPDQEQVKMHLSLHKADPQLRQGILLFNFGGPGGSAADSTIFISQNIPQVILDRFDIIGLDPRGTGNSAFVEEFRNCDGDNFKKNSMQCDPNTFDFVPFIGTQTLVKDMDRLRDLLGEQSLNFIGYSYGTRVGALYATQYPEHARAIVLDSPVSASNHSMEHLVSMGAVALKRNTKDAMNKICELQPNNTLCSFYQDIEVFDQHPERYQEYSGLDHQPLVIKQLTSLIQDDNNVIPEEDELAEYITSIIFESNINTAEPEAKKQIVSKIKTYFEIIPGLNTSQIKKIIDIINKLDLSKLDFKDIKQHIGTGISVMCTDRSVQDVQEAEKIYQANAPYSLFSVNPSQQHLCKGWNHPEDPVGLLGDANAPVLIIGNEFDFATPSEWYEEMKAAFPKSYPIWIKNSIEHGYLYNGRNATKEQIENDERMPLEKMDIVDRYVTSYLLHVDTQEFDFDDLQQGHELAFEYAFPKAYKYKGNDFYKEIGKNWQAMIQKAKALHEKN